MKLMKWDQAALLTAFLTSAPLHVNCHHRLSLTNPLIFHDLAWSY